MSVNLGLNFDEKIVVVSGAGHGIGRQICKEFILRGANVIATDILQVALEETKKEIESEVINENENVRGKINTYICDLTKSEEVLKFISEIINNYKKIDILVNAAGGVVSQVYQPVENINDEQWDEVIKANLYSTFFMIRAVAPYMKQNKYGRIVNISSLAGRSSSLTGIQAYTSAKAGQVGLTRQMAQELGPFGITVNNVAPGFVLSNPSTQKQWDNMPVSDQKNLIESIALKRLGTPKDIAFSVLFFASDFSCYVSGQVISVDGGKQLF